MTIRVCNTLTLYLLGDQRLMIHYLNKCIVNMFAFILFFINIPTLQ